MSEQNNKDSNIPDPGTILTLTTDDGKEVKYEFLDLISYSEQTYAVLSPVDDEDLAVIFRVDNPESEINTFVMVEDEELSQAIFDLFKVKNPDLFD